MKIVKISPEEALRAPVLNDLNGPNPFAYGTHPREKIKV